MLNFDPSKDKDARKNLDALWEKLSDGGEPLMPLDTYPFSDRYGWIKDKYGVTWQIVPVDLDTMMQGSEEEVSRVTKAFLKMKKFDLATLKTAHEG